MIETKVLVVEDDELFNAGICYNLRKEHFMPVPVYSFADARRKFGEGRYGLVILDINLPDGNGMELCREVREADTVPVLFLTADDLELDMVKAFQALGQFWSYAYTVTDRYENIGQNVVYLSDEYKEMFPIGTELKIRNFQGSACSVHVGGYVEADEPLPAGGMAPVVYLSQESPFYMENLWDIYGINVMCTPGRDSELLAAVRGILPRAGIRIESKAEWEKSLAETWISFME